MDFNVVLIIFIDQVAINRLRQQHEEDVMRLTNEKESNALQMNQEKEEIVNDLKAEFENLAAKYEKEKAALINEVALVQKERDEMLVNAENEKQEVLHLAANEKAALTDKGNKIRDELDEVKSELDKVKRESFSRAEQAKVLILIIAPIIPSFFHSHQFPWNKFLCKNCT